MSNQNFWPVMKQADKCVSCKIKGWKDVGENDVENGAVNGAVNGGGTRVWNFKFEWEGQDVSTTSGWERFHCFDLPNRPVLPLSDKFEGALTKAGRINGFLLAAVR